MSVVSLFLISICLAKSCSECWWFVIGIKVGNIAEGAHAESCYSLTAFFCDQSCHRGWGSHAAMPKYHRRDIQQMAEKYTLQSKMTEENNRVIILFIYFIIVTFPLISMLHEKLVELLDHTVILFFHKNCKEMTVRNMVNYL